jgi:acyl-CoA synthetase (NDP forming)
LEEVFHPRSVAVVGASAETLGYISSISEGKLGDRLFLVNPKYQEFMGRKCYSSLLDIPHPVDYVIVGTPARVVPEVIEDCVKKGVKAVHIYSSGFSEVGEEGARLEREVVERARGKLRIIGPNGMGIYCPEAGLFFLSGQPHESGPVGFVSQSGTFAIYSTAAGELGEVRFSKVVSYGNAADLDAPDFVEYLAEDPQTKLLLLYVEGTRRGRELFQALRKAASRKPVLMLKGGMTPEGARAASSHTGSLAGSQRVWEAVFRQTGVVPVGSFEEMVDTARAFLLGPPPRGRGVSMASVSGGVSVVETDACVEMGLEVPAFGEETLRRLREMLPVAGTSIKNPLDVWPAFVSGSLPQVLEVALSDGNIHSLILEVQMGAYYRELVMTEEYLRELAEEGARMRRRWGKPVLISNPPELDWGFAYRVRRIFREYGLPVYESVRRAAKALFNLHLLFRRYGEKAFPFGGS